MANTAELHAAVLDELIAGLPAEGAGSWQTRLEMLLRSYAHVLFTYPGLARSALIRRPAGPNAVELYEGVPSLLLEGGVPADLPAPGDAAPANDAAGMDALEHALRGADQSALPHIAANVDALLGGTPQARTTWAINALIAGIAATPTNLTMP